MSSTNSYKTSQAGDGAKMGGHHRVGYASPAPLGFAAIALTSFVAGMINTGLLVHFPQAGAGVALGFDGIGQFMCGILPFIHGDTFTTTTMFTYSGFWFSYGVMIIGAYGLIESAATAYKFEKIMGVFQLAFLIISIVFFLAALHHPYLIQVLFLCIIGAIGCFTGSGVANKVSGWFSIILAVDG